MNPKKEEDVEIVNPEKVNQELNQEPSDISIDLDAKPESEKLPEKQEEKPKPQTDQFTRLNNTIAYQTRQLERAMRELGELKEKIASSPRPTVQEDKDLDEIDRIAQNDWKAGVKKVVEKDIETKVNEILARQAQAQKEQSKRQTLESELEKSRKKVLERYPSIEDEATEESTIFRQVINEDPSLLQEIHGPETAMYRMEEKLREMGRTPVSFKPMMDKEVSRLVRAGASSVVGKSASSNGNKITLTKEQKSFCDHYKIPYEQYAKNLKAQDSLGGIEV